MSSFFKKLFINNYDINKWIINNNLRLESIKKFYKYFSLKLIREKVQVFEFDQEYI